MAVAQNGEMSAAGSVLFLTVLGTVSQVLGFTHGERINALVVDVIRASRDQDSIRQSEEAGEAMSLLREFMFENVYTNPMAKGEEGKARDLVKYLYTHFTAHVEKMPEEYRRIAEQEGAERAACDYISGMSDRYAVSLCEELLIPKFWQL